MNKVDHELTDDIVCPYCGCVQEDSWDYGEPDAQELGLLECEQCQREFYAQRIITVSYSTLKPTYGTCSECGKQNVIVENDNVMGFKQKSVGISCCYSNVHNKLLKKYIHKWEETK